MEIRHVWEVFCRRLGPFFRNSDACIKTPTMRSTRNIKPPVAIPKLNPDTTMEAPASDEMMISAQSNKMETRINPMMPPMIKAIQAAAPLSRPNKAVTLSKI